MESVHNGQPTAISEKIYLKDKPLIYFMGALHLAAVCATGYFMYEDTSLPFAIGLMLLTGLFLFSTWYPGFRARHNAIEINPQILRIDDCEFKEIPWSDISHLDVVDHFSARLGRFVHLIIYVKNDDEYTCASRGRFFSRQRADGGIFATDLYNYAEDHERILNDLFEALHTRGSGT